MVDQIFVLTPSASDPSVAAAGSNVFQMCFTDPNQGASAAELIQAQWADAVVGVIYDSSDPYSKGIYDGFTAKATELGLNVQVVTSFTKDSNTDLSTQVTQCKDAGCTLVFLPIYYTPASQFMTQANNVDNSITTYYGCDGFDGIDNIDGFDINAIPQEVTMLSHFNSKATEGAAKEFIDKYVAKFGADTLNQFGASAYDCIYAIYGAMKKAMDAGEDIAVTISASDLCDILKAQFDGGYTVENAVTGDKITWEKSGYVNKSAIQYVIKEAN